ncbi:MAG: ECF-type sigma factor [Pseudomonadota bacterium]
MSNLSPQRPAGTPSASADVTSLLRAAGRGDEAVLDAVFSHVYRELSRLASRVRRGRAGATLDTSALVHEAYLKLVPSANVEWESRRHFFGAAARAMRQILVDAARRELSQKRGGDAWLVTFDEQAHAAPVRPAQLVALDEALERLREVDARRADVVLHRYFGGLTAEETAQALDLSVSSVERAWRGARAWLTLEMAQPQRQP